MLQRKTILACLAALVLVTGCTKSEKPAAIDSSAGKSASTPSETAAEQPVTGGQLVGASIGEPSTLLPPLASDSASFDIIGRVYDTILEMDGDYQLRPKLAKSWEILDGGLRIRFVLHDNIRWHDGKPLTAADVVHSFDILRDPQTPTAYASNFDSVSWVRAVGDYAFEVSYKEIYAPALVRWASFNVIPKHLVASAKDIARNPLTRHPIGSGPYKFVEWRSNDRIVLKANDDYFLGRPPIDTYVYRIIPDSQTMFMELKSGGIDSMGLTPIQWTKQTQGEKFIEQFDKYQYGRLTYTYLGFNLQRKPFDQREVRQAINYAIDRNQIVNGVLKGLGKPALGPYVPGLWYSHTKLPEYTYDTVKAKTLLNNAGFADSDGDGILDRDGKAFAFEILTNLGNDERKQTAEIIQQNLKAVGIDVSIRIIEWSAFLEKYVDTRNFDAIILGWSMGTDPDQYNFWHSSQTAPTQFNFVTYRNPRVDALLEQGVRTFDQEERKRIYFELQEILVEDVPYAWLYVPDALTTIHKKVRGVQLKPAGIGHNMDQWWIRP